MQSLKYFILLFEKYISKRLKQPFSIFTYSGSDADASAFTLETETACKNGEDVYGVYATLIEAGKACEDDPNCGKVCDKYCNAEVITLCVKGSEEIESPAATSFGSCLFKHERDSEYLKKI